MTAPINGPAAPADMRDVKSLREVVDKAILVGDLREQNAALFRSEMRSFMARCETEHAAGARDRRVMLRHLEALVVIPSERPTLAPLTWQERAGAWLSRPASTRAVLALAAAGVLATLSGCVALMGVYP